MAEFAIRHLSVLSYAQGYTTWHFHGLRGGFSMPEMLAPGFFNEASDLIAPGDTIIVNSAQGGAHLYVHQSGEGRTVRVETMCATARAAR